MTQIIGFAGKKQSGKNTCSNFLMMLKLVEYGVCKDARLDINGNIVISDLFGEKITDTDWIPLIPEYVDVNALYSGFTPCKIYSFADSLKKLCINVLGLPYQSAYGSDQDKAQLTDLLWENMPGVVTEIAPDDVIAEDVNGRLGKYYTKMLSGLVYHKPGRMTAREVLQFVGTEIFRKMDTNVWINACLRIIENEAPELALVSDVRFPNEIRAIQDHGGIVVGLPRDIYKGQDQHASEQIDFSACDFVLKEGTIGETVEELYSLVGKYVRINKD